MLVTCVLDSEEQQGHSSSQSIVCITLLGVTHTGVFDNGAAGFQCWDRISRDEFGGFDFLLPYAPATV